MSDPPIARSGRVEPSDTEKLKSLLVSHLGVSEDKARNFVQLPQVQSLLHSPERSSMATNRRRETVHVVYDQDFEGYEEQMQDIAEVLHLLGYECKNYIVRPSDVEQVLADVPVNDIVWMHCDLPPKSPRGTKNTTARWIESHFNRVVGSSSEYSENCSFKSTMYELFERYDVPHSSMIRLDESHQLEDEETRHKLESIGLPLFIKVDDGYNSMGLSDNCILHTVDDALAQAREMMTKYGSVVIQKFLNGREFTVAVSNGHAYAPVERIFEPGQQFSGESGTKQERILDDPELCEKLQKISLAAYEAVGGSAYGRVDIRGDAETGEYYILEVNNNCSVAHNSYFTISLEAAGVSRAHVFRQMLDKVL